MVTSVFARELDVGKLKMSSLTSHNTSKTLTWSYKSIEETENLRVLERIR